MGREGAYLYHFETLSGRWSMCHRCDFYNFPSGMSLSRLVIGYFVTEDIEIHFICVLKMPYGCLQCVVIFYKTVEIAGIKCAVV